MALGYQAHLGISVNLVLLKDLVLVLFSFQVKDLFSVVLAVQKLVSVLVLFIYFLFFKSFSCCF